MIAFYDLHCHQIWTWFKNTVLNVFHSHYRDHIMDQMKYCTLFSDEHIFTKKISSTAILQAQLQCYLGLELILLATVNGTFHNWTMVDFWHVTSQVGLIFQCPFLSSRFIWAVPFQAPFYKERIPSVLWCEILWTSFRVLVSLSVQAFFLFSFWLR